MYILELNGIKDEVGVSESRVLEYARNRVLSNIKESLSEVLLINNNIEEVERSLRGYSLLADIVSDEEGVCFIEELIENGDANVCKLIKAEIEKILLKMTLEEAVSIISTYDESVTIDASKYSFTFLECYKYSYIENFMETVNNGVGKNDFKERISLVELGEDTIGEKFFILKNEEGDAILSFSLSGVVGGEYSLRCIFTTPEYNDSKAYNS